MHSDDTNSPRERSARSATARVAAAPARKATPRESPTRIEREARVVRELLEEAVHLDGDDPERWARIDALHMVQTESTFAAAAALAQGDADAQCLAADVLAWIRRDEKKGRPFVRAAESVLLRLADSPDERVVRAAVHALGQLQSNAALATLLAAARHRSAAVRLAAATHLGAFQRPDAHACLAELARDPDAEVRTWAVMGLHTFVPGEPTSVGDALVHLLADPDEAIRGEALLGLAERNDPRGRDALARELERGTANVLAFEAAERYADPRYLAPLLRLRRLDRSHRSWVDDALEDAIQACRRRS